MCRCQEVHRAKYGSTNLWPLQSRSRAWEEEVKRNYEEGNVLLLGESYGQGAHGLAVAKAVIAVAHDSVGGVVIAAAVHRKEYDD